METPQHLFALTKGEQRIIVLIMIVLLAVAAARFCQNLSLRPGPSPPAGPAPAASPVEPESADEQARQVDRTLPARG